MRYASLVRTTVDIGAPLLKRVRRLMQKRGVTLRALVEEGLERVLESDAPREGATLRDASFDGELGFARGAGPEDVREAIRAMNEPRL